MVHVLQDTERSCEYGNEHLNNEFIEKLRVYRYFKKDSAASDGVSVIRMYLIRNSTNYYLQSFGQC
jgi:hypothetical protein